MISLRACASLCSMVSSHSLKTCNWGKLMTLYSMNKSKQALQSWCSRPYLVTLPPSVCAVYPGVSLGNWSSALDQKKSKHDNCVIPLGMAVSHSGWDTLFFFFFSQFHSSMIEFQKRGILPSWFYWLSSKFFFEQISLVCSYYRDFALDDLFWKTRILHSASVYLLPGSVCSVFGLKIG